MYFSDKFGGAIQMCKIKMSVAHPTKNMHLISNLNADKIKVKQMQQLPESKEKDSK